MCMGSFPRWHTFKKNVLTYYMETQVQGHSKSLGRQLANTCTFYTCSYLSHMCLRSASRSILEEFQEVETNEDGISLDLPCVLAQPASSVPTARDLAKHHSAWLFLFQVLARLLYFGRDEVEVVLFVCR